MPTWETLIDIPYMHDMHPPSCTHADKADQEIVKEVLDSSCIYAWFIGLHESHNICNVILLRSVSNMHSKASCFMLDSWMYRKDILSEWQLYNSHIRDTLHS